MSGKGKTTTDTGDDGDWANDDADDSRMIVVVGVNRATFPHAEASFGVDGA